MKVGLDDFLNNHSISEFEALPKKEVTDDDVREAEPKKKGEYFIDKNGNLYRWKETKEGMVCVRLANFAATITEEVLQDDGVDVINYYRIKGKTSEITFLPIEIPASHYLTMNWVYKWGAGAIIDPGPSNKDYVRHAIQVLSFNKTRLRTCYTHTGWRYINGQWCYLSNAGAIGAKNVYIKLSRELARYAVPLISEKEKEAINASLSFLLIGSKEITIPLFAFTYLASLTTLLNPMPNFSAYLYGQSGTFKSTVGIIMLGHFGNFSTICGLNNFDDSPNAIEKRAFILKDTLLLLDDYHPSSRRQDAQAKESLAQRIIRSFANRTGRGRLNADTTDKGHYEPRGMLVITGEELVTLQSTLARLLIVEFDPGAIDQEKLETIQMQANLLPYAMTSFLLWIRDNIKNIQSSFPARFQELRNEATKNGVHKKVPEQTAFLSYVLELITRWLQDKGVYSEEQAHGFMSEAWDVLIKLGEKNARRIEEDDPVKRFGEILYALMTSGSIRLDHISSISKTLGGGEMIGYYDDQYLYFLPTAMWHGINRYCLQEGSHFPLSKQSLYKMLRTKNILIPNTNGESTSVIKVNGNNQRVIKLYRSYLRFAVTAVTEGQGDDTIEKLKNRVSCLSVSAA